MKKKLKNRKINLCIILYILQGLFPDFSIEIILVIAFMLFGIGHLYQGIGGIVKTAENNHKLPALAASRIGRRLRTPQPKAG